MTDNYIPFGLEWRAHVMRLNKAIIVDDLLTPALKRLDQVKKYDISKLEAATESLRHIWENEDPEFVVLAVDNFLRAITRQPVGEKQSADTVRSEDSNLHENQ